MSKTFAGRTRYPEAVDENPLMLILALFIEHGLLPADSAAPASTINPMVADGDHSNEEPA